MIDATWLYIVNLIIGSVHFEGSSQILLSSKAVERNSKIV